MNELKYKGWTFSLFLLLLACCSGYFSCSAQTDSTLIKIDKSDDRPIAIGYGIQKQRALTGSVSTIWSEDLMKNTVTNVGNALYGKLAGLLVSQRNGEPGNDVPAFLIRGTSTYAGATAPLIMVDGFQRSFDQLTLNEIESITILKDAASTAIYGMRGANGVILVTTKRGVESRNKIGVSLKYGMQEPTRLPDFVGSYDYAKLYNEALTNDGSKALYSADQLQKYRDKSDPYYYPDVNWFDAILKKSSPVWEAGMNFSGGNKVVRHYVMVNFMKNEGLFKNTELNDGYSTNSTFKRLNFRSNVDIKVNSMLTASLDIGGRLEDRNAPGTDVSAIFNNIYGYAPNFFPVRNPNGSLGGNSAYQGNPLGLLTSTGYARLNDRNFQSTFRLEHTLNFITNGLKIGTVGAFDNYQRSRETYTRQFPVYQLRQDPSGDVYQKFGQVTPLARSAGYEHNYRSNFEAYMEYSQRFKLHELSAKILYHQDKYVTNWNNDNNRPYLLIGLHGRVHYGYDNKYFAEAVVGYNGTERFPKANRFGFFPAVAASWIVSEEQYFKQVSWIDKVKIRASYGLTGNDGIGAGNDRNLYVYYFINAGSYPFGNSNANLTATKESNYPNYNIRWEKAYKTDFAVEGRFFNKLDVSVNYFNEHRTGIVDSRVNELPGILGIDGGYINYGVVKTKGLESTLGLNGKVRDFSYTASVNTTFVETKIEKKIEPAYPNAYQTRIGHSVGQIFGLEATGFFKNQAEIDDASTPYHTFTPVKPGDIRYKDQNNDGLIDSNDEVPIGKTTMPAFYYGFNMGVKYKELSLEASFQGIEGSTVLITSLSGPVGKKAQISEYVMNRWTAETDETAEYPRLTTTDNNNNFRTSTLWLRSGDFLRLRSLELGYDLPEKAVSVLRMSSLRVFLRGMNLVSFDGFKKLDPETFTGYPALRSYSAGLTLQF
jgi:TonB-linked SusC/RagA family outer membrane protein